jgi:hypothetical protein
MSGINWDIVNEITHREADAYALKLVAATSDSLMYSPAYNGYFAGKMKDAAERESLRIIVARLEKAKDSDKVVEKELVAPNVDDFI